MVIISKGFASIKNIRIKELRRHCFDLTFKLQIKFKILEKSSFIEQALLERLSKGENDQKKVFTKRSAMNMTFNREV